MAAVLAGVPSPANGRYPQVNGALGVVDAVGGDQRAVQQQVLQPVVAGVGDDVVEVRGLVGEDVDALVDVAALPRERGYPQVAREMPVSRARAAMRVASRKNRKISTAWVQQVSPRVCLRVRSRRRLAESRRAKAVARSRETSRMAE